MESQMWISEQYNKDNLAAIKDAKEIIQKVSEDGLKTCDIILDIGCGSGNITKMLSQAIPHKQLYAFDSDENMLEFSRNNYQHDSIQYFLDDIGLQWSDLSSTLKKLEGKVSLVFSNYVLHWIEDKGTAAKNIARLLKPGGRCYLCFLHLTNPNRFLDLKDREEAEQFIKYPSQEEDLELWREHFSYSGLSSFEISQKHAPITFSNNWSMTVHLSPSIMMMFVNKSFSKSEKQDCIKKYRDLFLRGLATEPGNPILKVLPTNPKCYYVRFLVTGIK